MNINNNSDNLPGIELFSLKDREKIYNLIKEKPEVEKDFVDLFKAIKETNIDLIFSSLRDINEKIK